jgi:hypothetical protein
VVRQPTCVDAPVILTSSRPSAATPPAKFGKSGAAAGNTVAGQLRVGPVEDPVESRSSSVYNPVQDPVDEAARRRLRDAILAEDGGEEHLAGVLRMLGERDLRKRAFPLFARAPADQAPNR